MHAVSQSPMTCKFLVCKENHEPDRHIQAGQNGPGAADMGTVCPMLRCANERANRRLRPSASGLALSD